MTPSSDQSSEWHEPSPDEIQDFEWHEPSPDEIQNFLRALTDVQRDAAAKLIESADTERVSLRRVAEFEGQINEPLGVQFSDGRRFVVATDGEITEYPIEEHR